MQCDNPTAGHAGVVDKSPCAGAFPYGLCSSPIEVMRQLLTTNKPGSLRTHLHEEPSRLKPRDAGGLASRGLNRRLGQVVDAPDGPRDARRPLVSPDSLPGQHWALLHIGRCPMIRANNSKGLQIQFGC